MSFDFREVGAGALVAGDVADGRQVRLQHAPQQPSVGRRARHGRRTASRVEGTGLEAVEGAGAAGDHAGARRLRDLPRPGAFARTACSTTSRNIPRRSAQFSKNGKPYEAGETLKQPDLAKTLTRIADQGPAGFYEGETAALIEKEMKANGGLITTADLKAYQAKKRGVVKGTYRGYDIIGMPPPSSGGIAVMQMLNILEGFDLKANGYGSAKNIHLTAESMRRAFADRARYLGDPDFEKDIPIPMLISKDYADARCARRSTRIAASKSSHELVRVHLRIAGDDAPVDRRRQAQRRVDDLHARIRATARRSSCPAPASCSTTRWATSTPAPASPTIAA